VKDVVDHGAVVFRTAEGTKLAAAVLGAAVAFEIDGYEPASEEAWSVVLKGRAREIESMRDVFDALDLPLFPWHAGSKHRFVRIVPDDVSGRRFTVVDRAETPESPHRASPE
jgi:nitroimidazol reductase NimA-like FMN-containing flavoprotein (pyridoxamine 5'-phosphate oxidase superfamily)